MYADQAALKARIVAWIAAGGQLKRIGDEPGMPCQASVSGWARRDAAFAEALRVAYLQRADREIWRFDEARAQVVLARMRAGVALETVLRAPDTPGRRVFYHWMMTQAHICEEVRQLQAQADAARRHKIGQVRWRAFDAQVADRLLARVGRGEALRAVLRSDRAFPSLAVLSRWREEEPGFDHDLKLCLRIGRLARGKARIAAQSDAVALRVREGESLRAIARDPAAPCLSTLVNWSRRRAAFAREVAEARAWREQAKADDLLARIEALPADAPRSAVAPLERELAREQARTLRRRWTIEGEPDGPAERAGDEVAADVGGVAMAPDLEAGGFSRLGADES